MLPGMIEPHQHILDMKKLIIFLILLLPLSAYAQTAQTVPVFGIDQCVLIREEDGDPANFACLPIGVTNGSLTDNGDGTFSLDVSGSGSGDSVTVNSSDIDTTANFLDGDIDFTLVDGGAGGPDDITATVACSGCVDTTDVEDDSLTFADFSDSSALDAITTVTQANNIYLKLTPSHSGNDSKTFSTSLAGFLIDYDVVDDGNANDGLQAFRIDMVNETGDASDNVYGILLNVENGSANATVDVGVYVSNGESTSGSMPSGFYCAASHSSGITNCFDASGSGVVNGLKLGSNNISTSLGTLTPSELDLVDGMSGKTGSDSDFATGTAGTSGNCAEWNADGDLVDSSLNCGGTSPKKRVYISATAGMCRTTNGCTDPTQQETTTNKINYFPAVFADDADDFWQSEFTLPENYDGSTFTFAYEWVPDSDTTSGGVSFFCQLMSISDDDALDTAFGTAVEVADDWTAAGDFLRSAESSAVTASGSPAGGDKLFIQCYRDVDDGDDDLAGGTNDNMNLMGIWLTFGIDSLSSED